MVVHQHYQQHLQEMFPLSQKYSKKMLLFGSKLLPYLGEITNHKTQLTKKCNTHISVFLVDFILGSCLLDP